jgi:co-chaperonin GroES (HSP10)
MKVLNGNVLVELVKQSDTTPGGIFVVSERKDQARWGRVLAVSENQRDKKGKLVKSVLQKNDLVCFTNEETIKVTENQTLISEDMIFFSYREGKGITLLHNLVELVEVDDNNDYEKGSLIYTPSQNKNYHSGLVRTMSNTVKNKGELKAGNKVLITKNSFYVVETQDVKLTYKKVYLVDVNNILAVVEE